MRITREALLRVTQDTVNQRVRSDRTLLAAFLCGSMLGEDYLLGDTTDLDLFYIHSDQVTTPREIIPLTEDIHFDIAHVFQRDFRQTRRLRTHPWLGPTINNCRILHDPQHFLDFIQAGVRGQFDRSDFVMIRAQSFFEEARQKWMQLQTELNHSQPEQVGMYLEILYLAGNSVASLTGFPLTERRFLTLYQSRAASINQPGLYPGLLGLLGTPQLRLEELPQWLQYFIGAFNLLDGEYLPVELHPGRRKYYQNAIQILLESSQPVNALWLLLTSWTNVIRVLNDGSQGYKEWEDAMTSLELVGKGVELRIQALDLYLDQVEEILEDWAQKSGAEYG